ncbi:MAG TPA: thiamine pyrophosphate-dependent enzyme [Jatrophihabitans sp.]|nr:thiamine pyrophosphate-dependent enzyme [Jatrophihabitans sp.]
MAGLTLTTVVRELVRRHPDACLVASCGYPSRELFGAADRPGNFYLVGSMGMAGPIALGLAAVRPDRLLVALDGDGSLLMNLGVLPMIAASHARLLHLVIDNGMHESTGGQQTVQRADFVALALASGYRFAARIERPGQLAELDTDRTPMLVQAITGPRAGIGPRVAPGPEQLVRRFRDELNRPAGDQSDLPNRAAR